MVVRESNRAGKIQRKLVRETRVFAIVVLIRCLKVRMSCARSRSLKYVSDTQYARGRREVNRAYRVKYRDNTRHD